MCDWGWRNPSRCVGGSFSFSVFLRVWVDLSLRKESRCISLQPYFFINDLRMCVERERLHTELLLLISCLSKEAESDANPRSRRLTYLALVIVEAFSVVTCQVKAKLVVFRAFLSKATWCHALIWMLVAPVVPVSGYLQLPSCLIAVLGARASAESFLVMNPHLLLFPLFWYSIHICKSSFYFIVYLVFSLCICPVGYNYSSLQYLWFILDQNCQFVTFLIEKLIINCSSTSFLWYF